jgi:dihydropyrimidinase
MAATLIKNGRIVTAVDDYTADILIVDGRVETIGRNIAAGGDVEVHDAAGLVVLPGGVDVHTHLDWDFGSAQTVDTFGTGTKAAAFGGTTTLIDFCNQPPGKSPLVGLEDWHKRRASACVDVGAHMIMLQVTDQSLADMKTLINREGVTSFKLFMAYPGVLMLDDGALFKAMRVAGANGAMTCVHAENGPVIDVLVKEAVAQGLRAPKYHATTRPTILEGEATHRAIRLAELAGTPLYIVHLSAGEALSAVTEARDRGIPVHAETCPHYLFLTEEEYERPEFEGAKYVMTPPLRTHHHQTQLWPVLLQRAAVWTEIFQAARARRLQQDPERRPRRRDPAAADLRWRRRQAWHVAQPFRRVDVYGAGQAVRTVPAQRHDRGRFGRRYRPVRAQRAMDDPRGRAP